MKIINTIFAAIFASMIILSIMALKSNLTFEDWDKDNNSLITRSEFVDRFTKNYSEDWNVNDDEHLDDEDFYTVTFSVWDADKDKLLNQQEWLYGYDNFFGSYVSDDFVAVDADDDDVIEYGEYKNSVAATDYYAVWDIDNDTYLDEHELARVVFNSWDVDDSNFIEKDEYKDFDSYYLDI